MTTVVDTADRTEVLERKIDALTEQVAFLAEEAAARRQQRLAYQELMADVSPLAGEAMAVATRELDEMRMTADFGDLVRLLKRFIEVAPTLERGLAMVDSLAELTEDVMPLSTDAMALVSDRLGELQTKGYFDFAKAGLGVVDRVVTAFSVEDVELLGDNVVTILETIKEITQPEMLALLQHMLDGLERQKAVIFDESAKPPGMWDLAKKMRDPDVRRGINRALNTLSAVTAETGPETMEEITYLNEKGTV